MIVELADGTKLRVHVKNLGYSRGVYKTKFEWGDKHIVTSFRSKLKTSLICPTPDLRLASDLEKLEAAIGQPLTILN